jgi:hypothetical protein
MVLKVWILGLCSVLVGWQSVPVPAATAALPPLSKERLVKSSSHIIIAKVRSISKVEVLSPRSGCDAGTDYNYDATVEILKVEKSTQLKLPVKSSQLSPGKVIQVKYWQKGKVKRSAMPPCPGDSGQRPGLTENTTVRLFMVQNGQGEFRLQEPNGSELLSSST